MKAPRSKLVSLRVAIIVPLLSVFAVTILIQSLTQYQTLRRMVDAELAQRLVEVNRSVQAELTHLLTPPTMAQRMLANAVVEMEANDRASAAQLATRLDRLSNTLSVAAPQINIIGFANPGGLYIGIRHDPDGDGVRLMQADPEREGGLLRLHAGRHPQSATLQTIEDYDARSRGWYIAGAAQTAPRWTFEPGPADAPDQATLHHSGAVFDEGRMVGVATAGIALGALDARLEALRIASGGRIAILDEDDGLIAGTDVSAATRSLRARPLETSGHFGFADNGETYQAHLEPFGPAPELRWKVLALLPESAVLAEVRREQLLGLVTPLALGLSALLGGLWLIGRLTQPISDAIGRVADLTPGARPQPGSSSSLPVREAVMLIEALSAMSQRMNNAFERLREAVMLDGETGLHTLDGLREKVSWSRPRPCLLMVVGVDGQSMVDNLLGSATGDQLALAIAGRLRAREQDALMIARIDRANFAVLHDVTSEMDGRPPPDGRLMDAFDAPFELQRDTLVVRVSVACVRGELDASTLDAWLEDARATIRLSRARGGGLHLNASDEIGEASRMRRLLCNELARADLSSALVTHYQPIVSLATGEVVAVEALTRWQHPRLGLLGPENFISTSETSALALEIGRHMLTQGCTDAMRHFRATGQRIEVHVNLSARQLLQSNFLDLVLSTLHECHLPPRQLVLELRESLIADAQEAGVDELMRSLHAIGARTAIDAFGRGRTAIGRLADLPLDYVKLDRLLVRELSQGASRANTVVATIIEFSEKLGLECVAVGVESRIELGILRRMGCGRAQGFLFGDPCTFTELDFGLRHHAEAAAGEVSAARARDGGEHIARQGP